MKSDKKIYNIYEKWFVDLLECVIPGTVLNPSSSNTADKLTHKETELKK